MNNDKGRYSLLVLLLLVFVVVHGDEVGGGHRVLECSGNGLAFFDVNPIGPKCNRDCETKFSTPSQWNQTFSFFVDDFFFALVHYLNFSTLAVNKPSLASYAQNEIIKLQDEEFSRELEQLRYEYDETLDKEEIETIRQQHHHSMSSKTTSARNNQSSGLEEQLVSLFAVMNTVYDQIKDHYNSTWHANDTSSSTNNPSLSSYYFEQFPNEFSCNLELESSIRVYKILTFMLTGLIALLAILFAVAYNYFEHRIMHSFTNYKKKS